MADLLYCSKCGAQCQVGDLFCKACGNAMAGQVGTASVITSPSDISSKSAAAAFFLCCYLGYFGIHRFYTGKIGTGILMLLTFGGVGIWVLIDLVIIASAHFKDKQGRYLQFKPADPQTKSNKSVNTALLLASFFGPIGIHRFYVGKIWTGILMILTFGGIGIWALIDIIMIACGNFKDKQGQYLSARRELAPSGKTIITVIGITIFSVFILIVLIVALTLYATSGLTDAAREQLAALNQHDYQKAYSYTSLEFQHNTSLEDFTHFVEQYSPIGNNKDSTFNERNIDAVSGIGTISGTLEAKDGTRISVTYHLTKENGMWKILEINVLPANAGLQD